MLKDRRFCHPYVCLLISRGYIFFSSHNLPSPGFSQLLWLFLLSLLCKVGLFSLAKNSGVAKTDPWTPSSALCTVSPGDLVNPTCSVSLCQSGSSQENEATPGFKEAKYNTKSCHLVWRSATKRSQRGLWERQKQRLQQNSCSLKGWGWVNKCVDEWMNEV